MAISVCHSLDFTGLTDGCTWTGATARSLHLNGLSTVANGADEIGAEHHAILTEAFLAVANAESFIMAVGSTIYNTLLDISCRQTS